jgi:hypothetical protein
MAVVLEVFQQQLTRLHEEFVCLDDGKAEDLFGGPGPLGACKCVADRADEAAEACATIVAEARQCCESLGLASSVWVELPDPAATAVTLEKVAEAMLFFSIQVELLASQRMAAVVRAKAAIESRTLVDSQLHGRDEPDHVLRESDMLDDSHWQGCSWMGLWNRTLQDIDRGTQPQEQTEYWASARAAVEDLLRQLRRHYFYVPSAMCHPLWAPAVLDHVFQAFDRLTFEVAHLHEEMTCLSKDSTGFGNFTSENPVVVLLAAAGIQKDALEWKCKLMLKPA